MSRFRCPVCDYVYDERSGEPREGFPAGTAWAKVPDDWCCPDCGVREKIDFEDVAMRVWECLACGFVYDEAQGWPEEGIAPGTAWDDIPGDWRCPDCGAAKADFRMVEAGRA